MPTPPITLEGHRHIQPPVGAGSDRQLLVVHNATGKPINDLWIKTGPVGFLEIEFPWGESGNPPDLEELEILDCGPKDDPYDKPKKVRGWKTNEEEEEEVVDEDPEVHVKFKEPWPHCHVWCFRLKFDDTFDPKEWLELSPTIDGYIVTGQPPITPQPPDAGWDKLLKLAIEGAKGSAPVLQTRKSASRSTKPARRKRRR